MLHRIASRLRYCSRVAGYSCKHNWPQPALCSLKYVHVVVTYSSLSHLSVKIVVVGLRITLSWLVHSGVIAATFHGGRSQRALIRWDKDGHARRSPFVLGSLDYSRSSAEYLCDVYGHRWSWMARRRRDLLRDMWVHWIKCMIDRCATVHSLRRKRTSQPCLQPRYQRRFSHVQYMTIRIIYITIRLISVHHCVHVVNTLCNSLIFYTSHNWSRSCQ